MSTFNQQKNLKAGTYTVLLLGSLLALCFIISWAPPVAPPVQEEEGMEVNLGDSETGSGEIQPLIPGDPAQETEDMQTPPNSVTKKAETNREIDTNEKDEKATPINEKKSPEKSTSKKEENSVTNNKNKIVNPNTKQQLDKTLQNKQPKAEFKGVKGNGGNNTDSNQLSKGQGIVGGNGDQGNLNGNPNSDSYTDSGGNGVSITRGLKGRKITKFPSFEDDFSENAKVAVDIKVDNNGNVTIATNQPRGTTTGNANTKNIALRKARQLKFSPDEDGVIEQMGTIIFSFRVRQ